MPDDHAAEILGPGTVDGAVDDHVPELLCARLLRRWRKRHEGIDLALREERNGVGHGIRYRTQLISRRGSRPTYVAMALRKTCAAVPSVLTATFFPLRSRIDRTRSVPTSSKHPTCPPAKITAGSPSSSPMRFGPTKFMPRSTVPAARCFDTVEVAFYPLHVGEPFSPQQFLGEVEGGLTRAGELDQPDPCGLWRWLRGDRSGVHAKEPCRPCERHPTKESPPAERSSV